MSMHDEQSTATAGSDRRQDRMKLGRILCRISPVGILCAALAACAQVPAPASESESAPPPTVVSAGMTTPGPLPLQEAVVEYLKQHLSDRRSKLAIAGGAAALMTILAGVGVRKILRGAPPPGRPGVSA